ncbi:dTDP-4-dehydrorhamnose 3,5-epimerase [Methylobacillus flagellatus]|uniref:dTDP-4-dehydrorhamnose 3,5-epimerase n=1 Tax=Methylobacillus flagellatus TaxID=405 RepID=UPI0010F79B20|nr:dTDP-4-dehydrorhamnose 3,5-epimerase [Methylobacillus flagellatus]
MQVEETPLADLLLITPRVFGDARGFFYESFNQRAFAEATGVTAAFVQDNHSRSAQHVLRGLHYQVRQAQGKLVRVTQGVVFDVAVDLRRASVSFGQWYGVNLSSENKQMLWIPPGFAHGFLVLSDSAEVQYKTTDYYAPDHERSLRWDDPAIGIDWPLSAMPLLSAKDEQGMLMAQAELFD